MQYNPTPRFTSKYEFTKIFSEEDGQEAIFNQVCLPMLADVYNEFKSGVIFSYGITNSGKTYTIIGNQKEQGILPRFIDYIFRAKTHIQPGSHQNQSFSQYIINSSNQNTVINLLKFSGLKDLRYFFEAYEIYNEDVYDLMDEESYSGFQ